MFKKSMMAKINAHQKALELITELAHMQVEQQNRNTKQMIRRIESQDALWDSIERIIKHLENTHKFYEQIEQRFELIEYRHQAYLDSKKKDKK